jgi:hypothetical protein
MMNGGSSWIEQPPQRRGLGRFAKSCLILAIFFILLVFSFFAGTYFAARYLRTEYLSMYHERLPASQATVEQEEEVHARWDAFEKKARARESARIELSAEDLNALVAFEPKLRGNAYVTIEDSTAHVQVSMPLVKSRWLTGRYINAQCSVQSATGGNPENLRITSIIVNGRPVGEEFLSWQYGSWSFKRYLADWAAQTNLKTLEISDGKVIFETNASSNDDDRLASPSPSPSP